MEASFHTGFLFQSVEHSYWSIRPGRPGREYEWRPRLTGAFYLWWFNIKVLYLCILTSTSCLSLFLLHRFQDQRKSLLSTQPSRSVAEGKTSLKDGSNRLLMEALSMGVSHDQFFFSSFV